MDRDGSDSSNGLGVEFPAACGVRQGPGLALGFIAMIPGRACIYVVSGGTGASAELVVHTVLAQFPGRLPAVVVVPHVQQAGQLREVVAQARLTGGLIVYTLVDGGMRRELGRLAAQSGVVAVDLMGELITHLTSMLQSEPLGRPGLYRQQNISNFERASAIEFAMFHDDGLNPQDLPRAQIVLLGVSRVGKTPLSMYLAVLGWKVANVALVRGRELPVALGEVDRGRVIGLVMEPERLLDYRQTRQQNLKAPLSARYTDLAGINEELEETYSVCKRHGYAVIGVTNKPLETCVDEITGIITRRFPAESRAGR